MALLKIQDLEFLSQMTCIIRFRTHKSSTKTRISDQNLRLLLINYQEKSSAHKKENQLLYVGWQKRHMI